MKTCVELDKLQQYVHQVSKSSNKFKGDMYDTSKNSFIHLLLLKTV